LLRPTEKQREQVLQLRQVVQHPVLCMFQVADAASYCSRRTFSRSITQQQANAVMTCCCCCWLLQGPPINHWNGRRGAAAATGCTGKTCSVVSLVNRLHWKCCSYILLHEWRQCNQYSSGGAGGVQLVLLSVQPLLLPLTLSTSDSCIASPLHHADKAVAAG